MPHDHRYHALIKLLAELLKEYHEKLASENREQNRGASGANRGDHDRSKTLAQ